MNGLQQVEALIRGEVEDLAGGVDCARVSVTLPRDPGHGDLTTNTAMGLAKALGREPFELAEMLAKRLARLTQVEAAEAARPGFINLRLRPGFWTARLAEILEAGPAYGSCPLDLRAQAPEAALQIGLEGGAEQSLENPDFSVQLAHARCFSVLRHAAAEMPAISLDPKALAAGPLDTLTDSDELGLIKQLVEWPRILEGAAEARDPHRIAAYLYDLAATFHGLWSKGSGTAQLRFLVVEAPALTAARLALVRAVAFVIAAGLKNYGVEPVEELR